MRQLLIAVLAVLPITALAAPPRTVTLDVQNMTCPVCPITVKKSLEKVVGVSNVQVDLAQKTATVTYDPEKTPPEALTEATTNAGYPSDVQN
ncbi:mercury resistance system periplasmic binding protein MerP [Pseudomonas putida]|uniref:mercury resistance system periplasmic binding protein MerP n=1 Tax=Pseudomonas TaxID=286 RepID=UPI00190B8967|nr:MULTISPECIES: mercury resistance system periplasmic binding protein MerP [Pseudomonas]EKT4485120.1 mercury resistance system periplasmic binding protein MerP [Pseudomonas putida]EKT4528436.1 mercury resistance system periplasmic binding protein MerP [Pseudomonas putida]MBK3484176.1 mercury resistance system periplasmic binding protein MerP [Pseudomonas fluorescens]MBO0495772.1 mercury resistance system periplasmic binding protein MerP [Pseudomonas sp. Marseille-Q1929]